MGEAKGTTFAMPEDLELAQNEGPLEAIQEEESMNDDTIHSGDTVRRGNRPEILKTRMSVNSFVSPSDEQPDKLFIATGKKWFAKMPDVNESCKLLLWFEDDK